jgi:hypothetical protein
MNVISGRTYLNSTGQDPESGLLSSAKLKEKEKIGVTDAIDLPMNPSG